jgi:hypothetical protein
MRITSGTSSLVMVLVTATGFVGGGGWTAGRTSAPVAADEHARHSGHVPSDAPAATTTAAQSHGEHHAHHTPQPSTARADSAPKHHSHDCEKGICRCDSRCPPRRSGPCGGVLRPCSGAGQDAGLGPGPMRPFLLSAVAMLAPGFERIRPPDPPFVPVTRALEPVSPPPRASSI